MAERQDNGETSGRWRKKSRLKRIVLLRGMGIYETRDFEFERKLNGCVRGESHGTRINMQVFLMVCG